METTWWKTVLFPNGSVFEWRLKRDQKCPKHLSFGFKTILVVGCPVFGVTSVQLNLFGDGAHTNEVFVLEVVYDRIYLECLLVPPAADCLSIWEKRRLRRRSELA